MMIDWNNLSYLMIQGKAIQGKARIVSRLKDIDTIKTAHSLLSEKYFQYKKMIVGTGDRCIVIDVIDIQKDHKLEVLFQLRKIDDKKHR